MNKRREGSDMIEKPVLRAFSEASDRELLQKLKKPETRNSKK